jgi:signal transduction histidine kinase
MKPLSLRLRLTLAFALVMAVLLVGAGFYIYARVASDLDAGINRALNARVTDVAALVNQTDTGLRESANQGLSKPGTDFAQVLDRGAKIFDSTPGVKPALSPAVVATAMTHTVAIERATVPGLNGYFRILAHPVKAQAKELVVVAGASLKARDAALTGLRQVMIVGGPALLVLASLLGYALAAMALRPVERMRRRAESISAHGLSTRLPTTGSRDEIDRLATTLNESLNRVEGAIVREQAFVADASHELRTPLTVLRTQLELIAEEHPQTTASEEDIRSAIEEVDRLAKLAEDLLLIARSDRDEVTLAGEPVPVGRLFERIGERMGLHAQDRLDVTMPEDDLWVRGDEARLEQALINLAENAIRHGGGRARLEAHATDGMVEMHVLDEGPGFPAGFVDRAFERFTQAVPGRSGDGAGLGLAIVRVIAEAHGGTAGVANRPTGGADAWITAPALVTADGLRPTVPS